MPTVYRSDDVDLPTFSYFGAGTANRSEHFTLLKDLLKACLVNGYGSKAAAGWTLAEEGSTYLILRNASASGYLGLNIWPSVSYQNLVEIWVSSTFTGVDANGRLQGVGVKTGSYSSTVGASHRIDIRYIASYKPTNGWFLLADEDTFYLNWAASQFSNLPGTNLMDSVNTSSAYCFGSLYAGDTDSGNLIVIGGDYSSGSTVSPYFQSGNVYGLTMLKNPETGALLNADTLKSLTPTLNPSSYNKTDNYQIDQTQPTRVKVYTGNNGFFAGYLKGLVAFSEITEQSSVKGLENMGLGPGALPQDIATPRPLSEEANYWLPMRYRGGFFMVTDDPVYW